MKPSKQAARQEHAELLISPDGTILAHNITPEMSELLSLLDPSNEPLKQRAQRRFNRPSAKKQTSFSS